ncbi:hypothetical protein CL614_02135 [archaeon]|nr:hypothetical protein [archaeon]
MVCEISDNMKVLAISGSNRIGNTEAMLREVLRGTKTNTELIRLADLKIKHCAAVCDCFERGRPCVIKDDMKKVLDKLVEADIVVLGSPNYWMNVSGVMKDFMDRTNPLFSEMLLKRKKLGIVCVGGQPLSNVKFCEDSIKRFAEDHKMKLIDSVIASADEAGEVKKNKKIMKKCFDLGKKLMKN